MGTKYLSIWTLRENKKNKETFRLFLSPYISTCILQIDKLQSKRWKNCEILAGYTKMNWKKLLLKVNLFTQELLMHSVKPHREIYFSNTIYFRNEDLMVLQQFFLSIFNKKQISLHELFMLFWFQRKNKATFCFMYQARCQFPK